MTTATNESAVDAVAIALRSGLRDIEGRNIVNEDVTKHSLIWPVLVALGYPTDYRIPEHGNGRNRPDDSCYLQPVNAKPGYAAIIVEAKEIDTDFDKRPPGRARSESPDRQIQRYLKQHSASGPNTTGVLTDGVKWRIYQRAGTAAQPDARFVAEYDFRRLADSGQAALPELAPPLREQLTELVNRLSRESLAYGTSQLSAAAPPENRADRLFAAMLDNPQPESVLRGLLGETSAIIQSDLTADANLQGARRDAHDSDWEEYAYAKAVALHSETPAMFDMFTQEGTLAVVRHRYDPEEELNRPEAALCARAFAGAAGRNVSATLVYTAAPDGDIEARLAISAAGQVNMTAAFNPALPTPSARAAIDRLLQRLEQPGDGLTPAHSSNPWKSPHCASSSTGKSPNGRGGFRRAKTCPSARPSCATWCA